LELIDICVRFVIYIFFNICVEVNTASAAAIAIGLNFMGSGYKESSAKFASDLLNIARSNKHEFVHILYFVFIFSFLFFYFLFISLNKMTKDNSKYWNSTCLNVRNIARTVRYIS
jgi:hypothetical protein